jgi:chemotaxis-related protein WspD
MSELVHTSAHGDPPVVNDCWNRIGVRGDKSCVELPRQIHCRNCPVYAAGAADLLDGDVPATYMSDWTAHFAQPKPEEHLDTRSVVIFRIASEWLALPTPAVMEVANVLPIHSLPHRQTGAVLGLASVRGELLVCVSLGEFIGLASAAAPDGDPRTTTYQRLLVIKGEDIRVVCPVDEVHGVHRFSSRDLKDVPATIAKAPGTYSAAVLAWRDHQVGVIDDQLLFYALKRSLR